MTQTENGENDEPVKKTKKLVDGVEVPKKKKAPKVPVNEEKLEEPEQEVPVKAKKKRVSKIESVDQSNPTEEPIKKKKPKASKSLAAEEVDEDAQIVELVESPVKKKSKKRVSNSFDDLEIVNPDDNYPRQSEISLDPTQLAELHPTEADTSEYQQKIVDAFANLGSKMTFTQFVGDDQWTIVHPPKTARGDQKSRIRKMLPGGNKDSKANLKPPIPKESLFKRIRTGVGILVNDPGNMIFGVPESHELFEQEEDPDGVDTDDLHRYAQKLRELEDQDREINPEYLVLRDGKTIYGVHEADQEGNTKLATRKPIFDRFADQKPDEQTDKKKLLSRLKLSFSKATDKNSKSENSTPNPDRKSSRKSLNDMPLEL